MNCQEQKQMEIEKKILLRFVDYKRKRELMQAMRANNSGDVLGIKMLQAEIDDLWERLNNLYEWYLHYEKLITEDNLFGHQGIN